MTPTTFLESNTRYRAPADFDESQVRTIPAFVGACQGGSCDGQAITVVAWLPSAEELAALAKGEPIFLTQFGGLAPHMLTTSFHQATHPA